MISCRWIGELQSRVVGEVLERPAAEGNSPVAEMHSLDF